VFGSELFTDCSPRLTAPATTSSATDALPEGSFHLEAIRGILASLQLAGEDPDDEDD
jgi:hypothetical protein